MLLTQAEINARLSSKDNLVNVMREDAENPTVKMVKWSGSEGGRVKGDKNLTEDERVAAGVIGATISNELAAEVVGCSPQLVSNIRHDNGDVPAGTTDLVNQSVATLTNQAEQLAAEKLLLALGMITEDKLSVVSAKDLSTIASNMSRTVQGLRPDQSTKSGVKVSIVLHQPKPAREEHFEIIEVSA